MVGARRVVAHAQPMIKGTVLTDSLIKVFDIQVRDRIVNVSITASAGECLLLVSQDMPFGNMVPSVDNS